MKRLVPVCLVAAASVAGLQQAPAGAAGVPSSGQAAAHAARQAAAPAHGTRKAARSAVPIVALTFDDGTADHLAVAKMLSKRGLKGTFYVNSARLGTSGRYLSVPALRAIARAGHEIGGHTLRHPHLSDESEAVQQSEICDDRRALLKLGFAPRSFAYPFGDYDEITKQLAMRCGYTTARGINGLYRPDSCQACPIAEKLPPVDLAAVRATSQTRLPRTARTLESFVTRAQQEGGRGLVTFVFHEIKNNPRDQYATAPKEFAAFVDWVARQRKAGKIQVRALGDLVGGKVWPVPDDM